MHPTGPYRRKFTWELRAAMTEFDMEPIPESEMNDIVDAVVDLQD